MLRVVTWRLFELTGLAAHTIMPIVVMDTWAIAGTSFLVALSGAAMPGPMLTVAIDKSSRRGFMAGPLMVVGHGLVEMLVVVALALGAGWVLQLPWVAGTIGIVGGVVLLWMAYGMVAGAWRREVSLAVVAADTNAHVGPVVLGGLVSVSNPYWILWWATVGLGYVVWSSAAGPLGLAAFFGGHILADLGWFSLIALLVARGRHLLNDALYRSMIAVCGLFLAALGAYFITTGMQFWLA